MKHRALFSFAVYRVALLSLAAIVAGCSPRTTAKTDPSTPPPARRAIAVAKGKIDIEGGLIRLAASRDGIIREILVEEGDAVRAGQTLAVLDDRQAALGVSLARCELAQAQRQLPALHVRLAAAQRELDRLSPLASGGFVERVDLDRAHDAVALLKAELAAAEAAVAVEQARLDSSQFEVDQRSVRAPIDGVIVRRLARPGDGVSTLNVTTLFLFAPASPRIVRAELDERFVSRVQPGMPAEITEEADETHRYRGHVLRLGRVFGMRQPTEDQTERQDVRVLECVLAIEAGELPLGQRMLVQIQPEPSAR